MKQVVLSCNNNPGYFFYAPIAEWAWNRLGYKCVFFLTQDVDVEELHLNTPDTRVEWIPFIEKPDTRDEMSWKGTMAQVVRHFAANKIFDGYIMTSDIDMIPLSDFLQPDVNKRTVWGWDLTDRSFIPVSYVGMPREDWYNMMGCTGDMKHDMEHAMKLNGRAYEGAWERYWDADWEILTERLRPHLNTFTLIERGKDNGHAKRRADRWFDPTYLQPVIWDMHLENHNPSAPEKVQRMLSAMRRMIDVPDWIETYARLHFEKYGI